MIVVAEGADECK